MSATDEITVTAKRQPAATGQGAVNFPDWRVTLDGTDLTEKLRPRLIALKISEPRGEFADQLDIELDATDGKLDIPKAGAELAVSLGWKAGRDVTIGLTNKGRFTVDEAQHSGPPDRITLRARSADFTAAWRKVRDQSWRDKTLGAILTEIAGRQGVETRIAASLAAKTLKLVTQSRESDAALLKRLGLEHDAVATVKNTCLIFLPMAGGQFADGESLPIVTIKHSDGDGHSYQIEAREDWTGVIAKWHDKKAAKQKTVHVKHRKRRKTAVPKAASAAKMPRPTATTGTADNPKILKKVFPSEAEARRAAQAEWSRIQRAPRKLSTALALGRPEIGAEQPALVKGFHPEIDALDWIVSEATHTLDTKGLTTSLSFELPETPLEGGSDDDTQEETA